MAQNGAVWAGFGLEGEPRSRNYFCRVRQSLRVVPAMKAGVADHVWTYEKIIGVVDAFTSKPGPRGPYKKRNAV